MRVLIDSSSVEVFVNEGETVMTAVVFPQSPYHTVTLESDRPITLAKAAIHPLTSIWEPETKDD